jgi:dolichol-phosphate mannosyltransferase
MNDRPETHRLDIIIPAYNEGANIVPTLTTSRVLICYDHEDDDTLPAIKNNSDQFDVLTIIFVRNRGRGAHGAVLTGFSASEAPFVLVYPADDDYNAGMLDAMVTEAAKGCDIVCASRFMPGGSMVDCPWLKAFLVRAGNFTLHRIARVPTHDASNGFRLFSRRALDEVTIESDRGFCYSIELLVKCHRPRLAHRRSAGALVSARARIQSISGDTMVAPLSALVRLRVCDNLSDAPGGKRAPQAHGLAWIGEHDLAEDYQAQHDANVAVDRHH